LGPSFPRCALQGCLVDVLVVPDAFVDDEGRRP
jgi:hypothetical protein